MACACSARTVKEARRTATAPARPEQRIAALFEACRNARGGKPAMQFADEGRIGRVRRTCSTMLFQELEQISSFGAPAAHTSVM